MVAVDADTMTCRLHLCIAVYVWYGGKQGEQNENECLHQPE